MTSTLFDIVEDSVRNDPERTAIITEHGRQVSYRRLAETVDSFAVYAARAGISKGNYVQTALGSGTAFLCMLFALSKLGAIYVPPSDPDLLASSGIKVDFVIVGPAKTLTGSNVIRIDTGWLSPPPGGQRIPTTGFDTEEETALILPSSGTTGRPKRLSFSLGLVTQRIEDISTLIDAPFRRTFLSVGPGTQFGLRVALHTLRVGGQIVWPGTGTLPLLERGLIDDIVAPPAAYSKLVATLKANGTKLRSVKRATMSGSAASKLLIESIQEYICQDLFNHYGSTELGPCAYSHVDDVASIPDAVGTVVPWVDARVVDDYGHELPRGEVGSLQLRIKPPRRIASYIGSATNVTTADGWFIPGDVGRLTKDGVLCVQGRATDVINIGGKKIASSLIEESTTCIIGETERVCAFGLKTPSGFDEPVIVIEGRNVPRLEELQAYLSKQHFRGDPVHIHILQIDALPVNEFGKIDKVKLREYAKSILNQRHIIK